MTRPRPTLLVVEDHEDNMDLIRLLVADLPLTMIEAVNGLDAVRVAEERRPDLILMDLSLPLLSGLEATARLKAAPTTAAIPIVALSAHALPADVARALAAGCEGYVTKPIELDAFRALLVTRLGLQGG